MTPSTPCSQAHSLATPPKGFWKGWVQQCFFLLGVAKALPSALRFTPFLPVPAAPSLCTGTQLRQNSPWAPTLACLMLAPFSVTEVSFTQLLNIVRYFGYIGKVQIRKQSTSVKVRNRSGKTASLLC